MENPYQAPNAAPVATAAAVSSQRRRAMLHWRLGWGLLMLAATDNFCQFSAQVGDPVLVILNGLGFVILAGAVFCFGLFALERIAVLIRWLFSGQASQASWLDVLYRSLKPVPWLAAIGTLIWGTWIACYYLMEIDFMVASVPAAIAGHLVAACFYLPLFYRWYRLERPMPAGGES